MARLQLGLRWGGALGLQRQLPGEFSHPPTPMVGETTTLIEQDIPWTVKDVNAAVQNSDLSLSSDVNIGLNNGNILEFKSGAR